MNFGESNLKKSIRFFLLYKYGSANFLVDIPAEAGIFA